MNVLVVLKAGSVKEVVVDGAPEAVRVIVQDEDLPRADNGLPSLLMPDVILEPAGRGRIARALLRFDTEPEDDADA